MNEPACRAYRAAILPTFLHSHSNPKFNPKTKSNTNPVTADATYTELQASSASPKLCALTILYKN